MKKSDYKLIAEYAEVYGLTPQLSLPPNNIRFKDREGNVTSISLTSLKKWKEKDDKVRENL